ncbi:MAG: cell division protein SepF [Bacillota bacterium]|nr:cell division protein SepF [Bacillota bacterium]
MGISDTFWKWLGVQTEVEEEFVNLPALNETESKASHNIVSIHSNKNLKVVICEPEKFDEVQALADHLKNRRQIILNLENTPPEASQRIIDFISGAVYALDGQTQKLGKSIFMFAPSNIDISKETRSLIRRSNFPGTTDPFGGDNY